MRVKNDYPCVSNVRVFQPVLANLFMQSLKIPVAHHQNTAKLGRFGQVNCVILLTEQACIFSSDNGDAMLPERVNDANVSIFIQIKTKAVFDRPEASIYICHGFSSSSFVTV